MLQASQNPVETISNYKYFYLYSDLEVLVLFLQSVYGNTIITNKTETSLEILENGKYGIVCNHEKMSNIVSNLQYLQNYKINFSEGRRKYSQDRMIDSYYKLL